MLDRLEAWLREAAQFVAAVCVTGMLTVAGITMLDVLLRWLARSPITALNEIVELIFAVAIAACIPAGLANGVNLKVDMLSRWMSARVKAWLNATGSAALLLFFVVLAWQIGLYAGDMLREGRGTVILDVPQAPFIYAVCGLIAFGCVVQIVITANEARRAWALGAGRSGAARSRDGSRSRSGSRFSPPRSPSSTASRPWAQRPYRPDGDDRLHRHVAPDLGAHSDRGDHGPHRASCAPRSSSAGRRP